MGAGKEAFKATAESLEFLFGGGSLLAQMNALEEYHFDTGLTLSMEPGMLVQPLEGVTAFCAGELCMMSAIRESYADYEAVGVDISGWTMEEYASLIQESNGLTEPFTLNDEGFYTIDYVTNVQDVDFHYMTTLRRVEDGFWIVNFACMDSMKDTYLPRFETWAATIAVE